MKRVVPVFLVVALVAVAPPLVADSRTPSTVDPPIISWQAPAFYTPTSNGIRPSYSRASTGGVTVNAGEIGSGPVPFFPVTPCRQYDSRSTSALLDNTPRTVNLSGAPCGVPSQTHAIAVNITVFSITGAGSNGVFKVGTTSPPTTAWINYPPTETQRGNAGIVAVNNGNLVVQVNQGAGSVQFTVDVYGYYPDTNFSHLPTGDYFPIWGIYPGSMMILGRNDDTTAANTRGVSGWEYSTGNGSAGVEGLANGASGISYGVKGVHTSPDDGAAGVYGLGPGGYAPSVYTGFLSSGGIGVLGVDNDNYGIVGVSGYIAGKYINVNSGGTEISVAYLGETSDAARFYGNVSVNAFSPMAGNLSVTGTLSKGAGSFKIDHPLDPKNKYLYHSFVESPDMMNVYNGVIELGSDGSAVVKLPSYFEALNRDFRYQLTSIGMAQPDLHIALEVANNEFVVSGGKPYGKVSWQVTGIRKDPFANAHRIIPEVEKEPEMKGYYLHPIEYGQPPEKGISAREMSIETERDRNKAQQN